jgi:hypothetical protein
MFDNGDSLLEASRAWKQGDVKARIRGVAYLLDTEGLLLPRPPGVAAKAVNDRRALYRQCIKVDPARTFHLVARVLGLRS